MGNFKLGAQIMNSIVFLIQTFVRSIINHPFFVGFLIILFFLNKSFPFLFSLLVYASPILVSTAVLLGTLLSLGHINLPEIEKENSSNSNFVSLKSGVPRNEQSVGERDGNTKKVLEKRDENPLDFEPLIREKSYQVESRNPDLDFETKRERNWVVLEDYCSTSEIKNKRSNLTHRRLGEKIESLHETNVGNERSDDESDGDESVSHVPLIDELDPLLDENAPHQVSKSQETSNYGTDESDDDDDDTSEEDEFDDVDNDDEVGDKNGKEGENSSPIPWTEDDRKNVLNLGTIELERNERLENVIARRRWQRLMAEKNLIDLDSTDYPNTTTNNNVTISTTRQNPFDLPLESGSAPSHIHPRSNPFDFPFHNEEQSHQLDDNPHQGLSAFPPKEMSYRRHTSFSVGPSFSGESLLDELSTFPPKEISLRRHESFNVGPSTKLKPYFTPEFEGTSYSSLGRKLSDISESVVSSISESDSQSSDGGKENRDKVSDEEFVHEPELVSDLDHVSEHVEHGSESSEEDEEALELGQEEEIGVDVDQDEVEIRFGDVEGNGEEFSIVSEIGNEVDSKRSSSSSISGVQVEIPDDEDDDDDVASEIVELPKEPVYDSSPRGIHKEMSSSSISSEVLSETGDPTLLVKKNAPFGNKESNASNEKIEIDSLDRGENESKNASSSENKPLATDLVEKVVVLEVKTDEIQSSADEKLNVSTNKEETEEVSSISSRVIIQETDEELPSSDKSKVELSSEENEKLQEQSSMVEKEVVVGATISHDQKQENTKEIVKSKNDEENESSSDLKVERESNSTTNLDDVSSISVSDHERESIKEIEESEKAEETKNSLESNADEKSNSTANSTDISVRSVSDNGKDEKKKRKESTKSSSSSSSSSDSD